jgi:hypothetical protein
MTTINLDEALVGAEAMARELAGGREPSATEVRRIRHWISLARISHRDDSRVVLGALGVGRRAQEGDDRAQGRSEPPRDGRR